jgi:antirestriction protein ArdC
MTDKYFDNFTNDLIKVLESNDTLTWYKSWDMCFFNPISKTKYKGSNYLRLMLDSALNEREFTLYLTMNQANKLNMKIKKGSKGVPIVYYGKVTIKDNNGNSTNDDSTNEKLKSILRYSYVFNLECVDDSKSDKKITDFLAESKDIPINVDYDSVIKNNPHVLRYGEPSYLPQKDMILMPKINEFESVENYYSTYYHELCHWTGHENRLNRKLFNKFGSDDYAKEELIAELSSLFISNHLGLNYKLEYHLSYLDSWLKSLKETPNYLKSVISESSKVFNFLVKESN